MQLVDTHFHLDYYRNHAYWYEQINSLRQYTLCVTNSPEVYYSCKKLYPETRYVKFALGYNPQQSINAKFIKEHFIYELSTTRYLGEVGLDFSKGFIETKTLQIQAFEFICQEAALHNKIMSVHSRKAETEVYRIMMEHKVTKAIIHWYTGDAQTLNKLVDAGYYFSVNASMCSTEKGRNIILNIPCNKLLIESDGPFSKVNSKKYSPEMLNMIYKVVGETTGMENIDQLIFENFRRLLAE